MKCVPTLDVCRDGEYQYVPVGSPLGRGREVRVPVSREITDDVLDIVGVRTSNSGSTPVIVPERNPDNRGLVYLQDRSRSRGSWSLYTGKVYTPKQTRQRAVYGQRTYKNGPVWLSAGAGAIAVVAHGINSRSNDASLGGGPEYLLVMTPGAVVTIYTIDGFVPEVLFGMWDGAHYCELPPTAFDQNTC